MDASARIPRPIDLAHTPAFKIGEVQVLPPTREVVGAGRSEILEPLVMQVLVALHSARGATLSRDDLIDACWGGRAVTDDALNRVLSRLRALARSFGGFKVETITKVGYRLIEADGTSRVGSPGSGQRRQVILAGGAIAGLGLLAFAGWRTARPLLPSEQAELLYQKGINALQRNDALETQDPGSTLEAIALLTDATAAAPQSAPAWGSLAMAYAVRKRTVELSERIGLDARSRAAARRALAIDPGEGRALGAIRMLDPVYRNWARVEQANREAIRRSHLPILLFIMSDMLGSVGRWQEALSFSKQLDRTKFLIPGAERKLVVDLWATGDLQGADSTLDAAVRRWPQNPFIWRTQIAYLMFSGRPKDVLTLLRNPTDFPPELTREYFEAVQITAEALAGQRAPGDAIRHDLKYLESNPTSVFPVAQAAAALGDQSTAIDNFNGYYFGEGRWAGLAPKGGDEDRLTNALFHPIMRRVWPTPEFARLVERIGLEDYWRTSGKVPDYRRTA